MDSALFGAGPSVSGVEVDPREVRVRMGSFKLDVPRESIRSVSRSQARVGDTIGVPGPDPLHQVRPPAERPASGFRLRFDSLSGHLSFI
jgi:hypothetical protein